MRGDACAGSWAVSAVPASLRSSPVISMKFFAHILVGLMFVLGLQVRRGVLGAVSYTHLTLPTNREV